MRERKDPWCKALRVAGWGEAACLEHNQKKKAVLALPR